MIESIKLESLGGSGFTFDNENGIGENWNAVYKICLTGKCAVDPRCVILDATLAGTSLGDFFPGLGTLWPPNQSGESSFASCDLTSAARATAISLGDPFIEDCKCCYRATVSYTILDGGDQTDPNDPDADPNDPISFCPRLEPYEVEQEELVENATFLGVYSVDHNANGQQIVDDEGNPVEGATNCNQCPRAYDEILLPVENCNVSLSPGDCSPIVNAAGQQIEPLPTKIRRLKGYRVTYNFPSFDADFYTCFEGTINCESFQLEIPCRVFTKTFAPFSAKLLSVQGRPATFNGPDGDLNYWEVTFDILEDPQGFCSDYANRGTQVSNCGGDPDFHGGIVAILDPEDPGYIQGISTNPSPAAGVPNTRVVRDQDGFAATEPVMLDDAGRAEREGAQWYLRYCPDRCTNFADVVPSAMEAMP